MKLILSNRLVQSFVANLGNCASFLQHLLMRAAVAISLKLCWFAARVLLKSSARTQASSTL